MQYIYKGVVITSEREYYLIIRKDDGDVTNAFPINNSNGVYDKLTKNHIQLVNVELLDGTESMELENVLNTRPNFENIFFKLTDIGRVEIFNKENEKVDVWDLLIIQNPEFFTMIDELMNKEF
jgi:hypothetical protein